MARRWRVILARMARSPRFWAAQGFVLVTVAAHDLLEAFGPTNSVVDILPVAFLSIPLVYGSLEFGLAGSAVTSVVVLSGALTNWFYMQQSPTLPHEVSMVIIAVGISLLVGRQVDVAGNARRRARDYATLAATRQEDERRRISLVLHDDSVQALIALCHQIDGLRQQSAVSGTDFAGLRTAVLSVVQQLRTLSASLRPPILDELGLVPAVRNLASEIAARGGLSIRVDVSGDQPEMAPDVGAAVYRIVQEALRNAENHAHASRVVVGVAFSHAEITLQISDDGVGFDPSEATRTAAIRGHLGLLSMTERAEMLGGHLDISSHPGKGTRIAAHIPIASIPN